MFSDKCSTYLKSDPVDKLDQFRIPHFEPDRVFGLGMTRSFQHYTKALTGLQHSPFVEKRSTLYPFLVSEAKPEKNSPGFESIEAQTAFPIFSCVMLQQRLSQQTGVKLQPLVWFIPYLGDVWKVSACVLHQEKIVSCLSTMSCMFSNPMSSKFTTSG